MNFCNIIFRYFDSQSNLSSETKLQSDSELKSNYEIVGMTQNISNINIIIQEDKNTRWIKNYKDEAFESWVIKDASRYNVFYNIPLYGDLNTNYCNLIKDCNTFRLSFEDNNSGINLKIVGVYIDEDDYENFIDDYNYQKWVKYLNHKYNKAFKSIEEIEMVIDNTFEHYTAFMGEFENNFELIEKIKVFN
jgi:hypothetical protein